MKKKIMGASIGNCVHVAGVMHFLQLAEKENYEIRFLGPAVSIEQLFEEINVWRPHIVAISYRLTPENVNYLLDKLIEKKNKLYFEIEWIFGGTKPVADIARQYKIFSFISDGYDDINDSIRYLRGISQVDSVEKYGRNIVERIENSYPYPVLRHHFGRPSIEETKEGIKIISEAKVLDVISLGPDQNAQQFFFHPEKMDEGLSGAGGVPIRSKDDLITLKSVSNSGNYPLMRCYSGTEDVFQYAEMLLDTIDNAWAAIPLCWYNELDGRGNRTLEVAIHESMELIKWHAEKGIVVEVNEPHHWGLRDSHDVISVVMSYISAYNAKKLGVKNYISQYMFNNPNGVSFSMDLAKVLAMIEMVEGLEDANFKTYRETRAGLALFHADENIAKGQLAASTFMQMMVRPHIIHVVGYCEADHAATANEVIESCKIVKGVIKHTLEDEITIGYNEKVIERKNKLISESKVLLNYIKKRYSEYEDPLGNEYVLCDCIRKGIIDAVHIIKNDKFNGKLQTKVFDGKCVAYDKASGKLLSEEQRLKLIN